MFKGTNVVFLCIFGLFWSGITGSFDVIIANGYYHQIRAQSFVTTSGTVTHSEVTQHRGNKGGTTYGTKIEYTYEVNGQRFEGKTFRYGGFSSSSDSASAYVAVQERPVGATTTVHYDPKNPSDSALSIELRGSDLFMPLFLMPFNLVMLGIWSVPVNWLWRKIRPGDPASAQSFQQERRLHIRLPRYSPVVSGAATVGGASFASIFLVMIPTGGSPGARLMLLVWALVLGAGMGVGLWQWSKQRRGLTDLVLDPDAQTVRLPATFGRKEVQTLPATDITDVNVETIERRGSKGGTTYSYAVTLKRRGSHGEKLTDWSDQERANQFAAWLGEKLSALEPAAPPRKTK
ncbi:MAG: hypothetical protein RLY20_3205 [Verrucomicrobiota bacterium]|jgi:hypothetical protein